ncbi:hypothetical protein BKA70DRAFT_335012 [Coprinopsis sp. MPI-PUGE-AT-0042]|nr:hypothetical protein BKA70DRAFT_335012 [Coprinopsis sp. MPI-PUGE-AT-0042]
MANTLCSPTPSSSSTIASPSNMHAEMALDDTFHATGDPRQRLAGLDDEIARVERVLQRLKSMQPTLRRDINLLYSPILQILPTELIAEIFVHCIASAVEDLNKRTNADSVSPLFLGSVCSSWRQIAWTTPFLWTSPRMLLCKTKLRVQAELLEEWIGRAGDLSLTLKLHCPSDDDRVTAIPQNLFDTILCHASRWREIDLQVPTAFYENLSAPGATFSTLRRLVVNPSGGQGDRSHVLEWTNRTPELRDLSLFSVYLNTVRVQWDNITHIHAKTFYVDECLELIKNAPLLEYCNFYSITRGDDGHPYPPVPIHVPNLQSLALVTERSVDSAAILENIHAPELANLTHDVAERHFNVSSFKQFVTRSSTNLTQLSIIRASITEADLMEILPLISSVVDFRLNAIETRGMCLDTGVMSMLTPNKGGRCVLPNMTRFEYVGPFSFSWTGILGMLVSRRGLKLQSPNSSSSLDRLDITRENGRLLFTAQSVAIIEHTALRLREHFDDIESIGNSLSRQIRQLVDDGLELTIAAATVDLQDCVHPPSTFPRGTHNTH